MPTGCAVILVVGLLIYFVSSSCPSRSRTYSAPSTPADQSQDRRDAEAFVRSLPSGCHGSVSGNSPAYVDYRCDNGTTGHITLQNGRVKDIR